MGLGSGAGSRATRDGDVRVTPARKSESNAVLQTNVILKAMVCMGEAAGCWGDSAAILCRFVTDNAAQQENIRHMQE